MARSMKGQTTALVAQMRGFLILMAKRFGLHELVKGLGVTGRAFIERKVTVQFPEEMAPQSRRSRSGPLVLRRYPNGEERCIACKLCEAVCPALAITIESEPREDGSRRTTRFDIDAFKCIHCGLCEEACPVDSIVTTSEQYYAFDERGDNILTKEKLLAMGDYLEESIAKNRGEEHDDR